MSEMYELIEVEKANYPIVKMCEWAEVSRSGFYEWRDRPVSAAEQRRQDLCERIRVLFEQHDETYGHRRIHAALLKQGVEVALETVRQLMRRMGLRAVQPRAYRPTTLSGGKLDGIPDLVRRRFEAERPGQLLVGDITYLKCWQGWVYLATVIDVATRQVIGWAMAEHMRACLVVEALDMAARNYTLESGCIFHSDYAEVFVKPRNGRFACPAGGRWLIPRLNEAVLSKAVEGLDLVLGESVGGWGVDRWRGGVDGFAHHVDGREGVERGCGRGVLVSEQSHDDR